VSARDDYPNVVGPQGKAALAEIDRLRAWKESAMQVLNDWDQVWEAAGRPGPLGASKAQNVRALFTPDEVNEVQE
jgi:hypothetical protein